MKKKNFKVQSWGRQGNYRYKSLRRFYWPILNEEGRFIGFIVRTNKNKAELAANRLNSAWRVMPRCRAIPY